MRLKRNQYCPIHRSKHCCGRDAFPPERHTLTRWERVRPGVQRIKDEHAKHEDGYRYKLSKSEMERIILKKVSAQRGLCSICQEPLLDMSDVVPDHIEPKGLGGGFRDDRAENIGAAHFRCNLLKGSRRVGRDE